MGVITLRYLPEEMARLQWSLECIVYAIGPNTGAALGLVSPIQAFSGTMTDVTLGLPR